MNMEEKILQIPIEDIIPNRFQPRLSFDDQALQELASSIKQHGIIQPLVLRKLGDKYEIIAGERRYKAAQIAGLNVVPAVISNIDDDKSAEVALIENIQRKNLTSIEEAKSYKNLLDRGYMTQEQLAEKLGVSQSTIANKLRLLNLADEVQDALLNEKISERHARSLLVLNNHEDQVKWLNKILNERLTVRQLDIELKKINNSTDEEDDTSIPLVELTPNINDIKQNALDINPTQGLHDIESMLKPSVPGEKVYDLSNPIDNIETLDIDENEKNVSKNQNKFFNVLEDETADMNENSSIDDFFNIQPQNNDVSIIEEKINNDNAIDDNLFNTNSTNNNILENTIESNNELLNNVNNNTNDINNNDYNNNFFFNFNKNDNNNNNINSDFVLEQPSINEQTDNVIEVVEEKNNENIFDPMSMINTLEPNYEEKLIEEQGLDLKNAINTIRDTKESLENKGFKINMEEADVGDSYNISINIIK